MRDLSQEQDPALQELIAELAQQFIEELEQGKQPDIDIFTQRHPEASDAIRGTLGALQTMRSMSLVEMTAMPLGNEDLVPRKTLGDYRIIRELGRGGMGVVYEAEQISLDRRVALKILPFAAMLNPRSLQRFRNEVTAAARLGHPNVVDIYGVACERGVHHYAMRLIEGLTLADIINQLRSRRDRGEEFPKSISSIHLDDSNRIGAVADEQTRTQDGKSDVRENAAVDTRRTRRTTPMQSIRQGAEHFRSVAEFGAAIAEALDHSHQLGVVHRDVKPSNLMIDHSGKPWITDFGLAQVETGAALTLTGDLLGTARYMSPEQLMAKRVHLDHRTDIYSLGVTLYETLTLQLPFDSENRQELFRQIMSDEPRKLQTINPAVPHDLQTIVLKAIEKDPADRYKSAQELADDLTRFVGHQPIHAKNANFAQRFQKWSRRNQWLVRSAVVLLVVCTIGLSVFSVVLIRERNKLALEQTRSKQHLQLANDNLDLAMDVLDKIYLPMIEQRWSRRELTASDRQLVEEGLSIYQEFVERNSEYDNDAAMRTAVAYARLGNMESLRGNQEAAQHAIEQSVNRLLDLYDEHPEDLEIARELIDSRIALSFVLMEEGRLNEALRLSKDCIDVLEALPTDDGMESTRGKLFYLRGNLLENAGRYTEALQARRDSVDTFREIVQDREASSEEREYFLVVLLSLAQLEPDQKLSLALIEEADKESNSLESNRAEEHRMFVLMSLVQKLGGMGRIEEMAQIAASALQLNAKLQRDQPGVAHHQLNRIDLHKYLGQAALETNDFELADREFREATNLICALADEFPGNAEYQAEAGIAERELATVLSSLPDSRLPSRPHIGDIGEIITLMESAARRLETAVVIFDEGQGTRNELAMTYTNISLIYGGLGGPKKDLEKETLYTQKALQQWQELANRFPDSQELSRYYMRAGQAQANLALNHQRGTNERIVGLRKAVEFQEMAIQTEPVYEAARRAIEHHLMNLAVNCLRRITGSDDIELRVEDYLEADRCVEGILEIDPDDRFDLRLSNLNAVLSVLIHYIEQAGSDPVLTDLKRQTMFADSTVRAKSIFDEAYTKVIGNDEQLYQIACKQFGVGAKHKFYGDADIGLDFTLSALEKAKALADRNESPKYRDLLIACYGNAEKNLYSSGRFETHFEYLGQYIGELEKLAKIPQSEYEGVGFAVIQNFGSRYAIADLETVQRSLIWYYCLCPDPDYRDIEEAKRLTAELIASPKSDQEWSTVGAVECRTAKFDQAIVSLQRALAMSRHEKDTVVAHLFLALSHQGLGNSDQAKVHLELAEELIDKPELKAELRFDIVALLDEVRLKLHGQPDE